MKLKEACELAECCGLETIKEAVLNVEIHATSLFSYDEIDRELDELYKELENYDMKASIYTVI